jgi:hypothetical protein
MTDYASTGKPQIDVACAHISLIPTNHTPSHKYIPIQLSHFGETQLEVQ